MPVELIVDLQLLDVYEVREIHLKTPLKYGITGDQTDELARAACAVARERWAEFPSNREVHVEELVFVRENGGSWQDLARLALGHGQLSSKV